MKDIENEIAQVYAKGVLDFLDDCVWHKTIANWNMSNNSGTYRIYDNEDKEIYPQYDKENPSQYRKKRTEEDRLKSGMYIGDLMIKYYYKSCQNDPNLRWNKGTLTIYPNGAYDSEFIWDNEMYLSYCLADIENWLTSYFEQSAYRIEDKCIQLGIKWDFDVKVVISFTSGKANPVLFVTPNKPEINFKLYLDQLCECIEGDYIEAFEQWSITRAEDAYYVGLVLENEEMYHSMNYGELKGHFQHWNSAAFIINKTNWQNLTFEDIKFEWKEDLA